MKKIAYPTADQDTPWTWEQGLHNPSVPVLVEHAIHSEHARLSAQGALVAETAPRTGRSVKDKFIVRDPFTADRVAWGGFNTPIDPDVAGRLQARIVEYLGERQTFVVDALAGADPRHRLSVRVIAEYAWHALFTRQLFLRPGAADRYDAGRGFTVLAAPDFKCDPARDGVHSDAAIILDFGRRLVTIAGTKYAGEIKKSVFSYLNYVLPAENIFPMHCSANVGIDDDEVALFFGLSGTGKTTLSADPARRLIGDDEHGWGAGGVFNFEGGCYAKCVNLRREREPQIYDAIKFGAVLENVVLDEVTREPDYDDISVTENTRAAYPIDYIQGAVPSGRGGHARTIVFLTADAFGVMPPIARLDLHQALYYFLSGYTAKLAGTESDMKAEPEATFSTCFGAPFLALPSNVYAEMLRDRVTRHNIRCFLLNTGWTGGPYGVGRRIKLDYTRAMVRAALSGALDDTPCWTDLVFGLSVPERVPGVPDEILDPRATWSDTVAYDQTARDLASLFSANFDTFDGIDPAIRAAGPRRHS